MPWDCIELKGWDIVGMNHYYADGKRWLFVAMSKGGCCIKAEDYDETEVFKSLARQVSLFFLEV